MAILVYFEDEDEDEEFDLEKLSAEELAELRRKIQAGIDDMQQGRYITLKTDADIEAFTDRLIREAQEGRNNRL